MTIKAQTGDSAADLAAVRAKLEQHDRTTRMRLLERFDDLDEIAAFLRWLDHTGEIIPARFDYPYFLENVDHYLFEFAEYLDATGGIYGDAA